MRFSDVVAARSRWSIQMSNTVMSRKCYESVIKKEHTPVSCSVAVEQDDQADTGATRCIPSQDPAAQQFW